MSTVDVDTVDAVFQAFTEKGIAFGDAPVGRLAAHADKGESLFMLGIDEKHLPQVEPVLYKMGTTVYHCGKAGHGTRTKLINNMTVLSYCQINSEALVLAQARSEEHTSELQSLMRISYAVFCLKKKNKKS